MTIRVGTPATPAASGANLALPVPAGVQANDRLVAFLVGSTSSLFATNAVPGFSQRSTNTSGGSSPTGAVHHKVATGTESGTITVTSPGGTTFGIMVAIPGVDPTTPFDVADVFFGSSAVIQDFVIPHQIPTEAGDVYLIWTYTNAPTGTLTQPTGYASLFMGAGTSGANLVQLAALDGATAGETPDRTVHRSATSRGGAIAIALRPASPATTSGVYRIDAGGVLTPVSLTAL